VPRRAKSERCGVATWLRNVGIDDCILSAIYWLYLASALSEYTDMAPEPAKR
jgi:hypothetical protein